MKILKVLLTGISVLGVLLVIFAVWAIFDQHRAEARATAFCNLIPSNATTEEIRALLVRAEKYKTASISEFGGFVQFPATLPHYYLCSFGLHNGKVEKKDVVYKD